MGGVNARPLSRATVTPTKNGTRNITIFLKHSESERRLYAYFACLTFLEEAACMCARVYESVRARVPVSVYVHVISNQTTWKPGQTRTEKLRRPGFFFQRAHSVTVFFCVFISVSLTIHFRFLATMGLYTFSIRLFLDTDKMTLCENA